MKVQLFVGIKPLLYISFFHKKRLIKFTEKLHTSLSFGKTVPGSLDASRNSPDVVVAAKLFASAILSYIQNKSWRKWWQQKSPISNSNNMV